MCPFQVVMYLTCCMVGCPPSHRDLLISVCSNSSLLSDMNPLRYSFCIIDLSVFWIIEAVFFFKYLLFFLLMKASMILDTCHNIQINNKNISFDFPLLKIII